ncbi:hypothetical protein [Sporosarcina psychrophila]|uniref:hypothetical protein n=1 Tax=Sporosarcina psychrophila TaxID=1476 RepID=UPI00078EDA3A|nr:hypothetical protein [Sporosarcina psychrophila]AMQ06729.1 hypothetical protein AZE41_12740 [Sporosarcina psychrophila]
MTETVNIDIQRSGFPIKLGTVELWFDTSLENLRKFFGVEELAQEKLKEAQEKAQALHFPDVVTAENLDVDTVNAAFDVNKAFIGAQYDIIFGDGTFKKLYKAYPDIMALEQTLEIVGVAIGNKLELMESERSSKTELKKSEYLAKKSKKVGN